MTLSRHDVALRLKAAIDAVGSQKAYAQAHKISEQYLSDVLNGRREPGQKILDALGIERVVVYREK